MENEDCAVLSNIKKKIMLWPKVTANRGERRSGTGTGTGTEYMNNTLNVNEEYVEAFRTKSYIEIWSKVQGLLQPRGSSQQRKLSPSSSRLPPTPSYTYTHLSDSLLDPPQHILMDMIQTANIHNLLIDYFQGGLDASRTCGFLLHAIHQTRANYSIIQRVIKVTTQLIPESTDSSTNDDPVHCHHTIIFSELAMFAKLDNPLSGSNNVHFSIIHDRYSLMLKQFEVTRNRIARKSKSISLCKKASLAVLIVACSTLATAMLTLAVHSLVGIVAAPLLITTHPLAFLNLKQKMKKFTRNLKTKRLNKIVAQLDAAAKGIYILNRDFDTMSRLVMRLYDEIEHRRAIARLCLSSQKRQMLREVVKEFGSQETSFLKQLGELEEHVHLCILTVNRARRLVIREILVETAPFNSSKSSS